MDAVGIVDSFKYGVRFVAVLLTVLLVGVGAIAGGVTLAFPGLVGLLSGPADTTQLAGGATLGVAGSIIIMVGVFGLTHKLIADAVSTGLTHGERPAGTATAASTTAPDTESRDEDTQTQTEDVESTASEKLPPAEEQPDESTGAEVTATGAKASPTERSMPGQTSKERADADGGPATGEASGAEGPEDFDEWIERTAADRGDERAVTDRTEDDSGETPEATDTEQVVGPKREGTEGHREASPEEIVFGTDTGQSHDNNDPEERDGDGETTSGTVEEPDAGIDESLGSGSSSGDPLAEPDDE